MNKHNFEVIAEFKDDLSQEERNLAEKKIEKYVSLCKMKKINNSYFRENESTFENDFGSVTFFYVMLSKIRKYFKHLAYYDYITGETDVTI